MKSASVILAVAFLGACVGTRPAMSATRSSSFSVTVTAQATCQVDSLSKVLGNNGAAAPNPWSLVSVHCSNPTPYDVSLSAGSFASTPRSKAPIKVQDSAAAWYSGRSTATDSVKRSRLQRSHLVGIDDEFAQAFTADDEALGLLQVDFDAEVDTLVLTVIY